MMRFSPIYLILFTATSGYSLSVHAEETMLVTGSSEYMNNSMDNVAKFADPRHPSLNCGYSTEINTGYKFGFTH